MPAFNPTQVNFLNEKIGAIIDNKLDSFRKEIKEEIKQMITENLNELLQPLHDELSTAKKQIEANESKIIYLEENINTLKADVINLKKQHETTMADSISDNLFLYGPLIQTAINANQNENPIQTAKNLIKEATKLELSPKSIISAYRVGKAPSDTLDKRPLKIRVADRVTKYELQKTFRTTKPNGLFISEELTKTRNTIFFKLRKLKKSTDIPKYVWTNDGIIKCKKTPVGKTYNIENEEDFNKFLSDCNINLSDHAHLFED